MLGADAFEPQPLVEHVRVVVAGRLALRVVAHELVDLVERECALFRAVVVDVVVVDDLLLVRHLGHVLLEDDDLLHALRDAHEADLGLGAVELRVAADAVAAPLGPQQTELALGTGAGAAALAARATFTAGPVRQQDAADGRLDLVVAHRRRAGFG